MTSNQPHLAILGAGPIGLEAALAAAERGYDFTVYEAADNVAGHVDSWRHVRLFTPWSMNASQRMRDALVQAGRPIETDDDHCPTGGELIDHMLRPVAELPALRDRVRFATRVKAVGREGLLKHEQIGTPERATKAFRLLVETADGEAIEHADLVLDCTGKSQPNTLGASGIPALGERDLNDELSHDIPSDAEAPRFSGRTTLLVGAGHSAQTALRWLLELAEEHNGTRVIWLLRSAPPTADADDSLPERARLMAEAESLASSPPAHLDIEHGKSIDAVRRRQDGRLEVELAGSRSKTVVVDQILALTGSVGDGDLYRQLQIHECYATSGPMKLAAALMASSGSGGDCLAQASQGAEALLNPEPGFFILGSKSYGRRNDFLLRIGRQQVDEVFDLLGR